MSETPKNADVICEQPLHLLTKLLGLCVVVGEAEVEEEASAEVIPQRGAAFDRGEMARGWGYELGSHFYMWTIFTQNNDYCDCKKSPGEHFSKCQKCNFSFKSLFSFNGP